MHPVLEYRRQTTGSETIWKHGNLFSILYTDGVKVLADSCGAYWLIDLISSYPRHDFEVWTLTVNLDDDFVIECSDGDGNHIQTQHIGYSDFPRELLPLTLWCENGTILFPEER